MLVKLKFLFFRSKVLIIYLFILHPRDHYKHPLYIPAPSLEIPSLANTKITVWKVISQLVCFVHMLPRDHMD